MDSMVIDRCFLFIIYSMLYVSQIINLKKKVFLLF